MGFRPSPFAAIFAVGVVVTAVILLHLSIKPNEPPHLAPSGPVTQQVRRAQAPSRSPVPPGVPTVLILSPMKGAAKYLDGFFENLRKLTHPHAAISLGFLHSGGAVAADGMSPNSSTWRRLHEEIPLLQQEFRRVQVFHKDYVFHHNEANPDSRHARLQQLERRGILAKARNYLLARALDDEDYVLWIDVDLRQWPDNIVETLINTGKDIVVPNCVMELGGRSYDLNTWKRGNRTNDQIVIQPGTLMMSMDSTQNLAVKELVTICGRALGMPTLDIYKMSQVFKSQWLNTVSSLRDMLPDEFEALGLPEGLYKCLRPVIQASPHKTAVIYNTNVTLDADTLTCRQDWDADLSLEGYGRTGNIYLHKLRKFGEIVEIDSVGGAMLMIRADLHREGLVFPPYPYRGRIETEGLAAMAKDMGYVIFGLPNVEVLHP